MVSLENHGCLFPEDIWHFEKKIKEYIYTYIYLNWSLYIFCYFPGANFINGNGKSQRSAYEP